MLTSLLKIDTSDAARTRFMWGRVACGLFGHRWRVIPIAPQTIELHFLLQMAALISGESVDGYVCKRCCRLKIGREQFDLLHSYTEAELGEKIDRVFTAESVRAFVAHLQRNAQSGNNSKE